jgi:hypothetical protein
MENIPVVTETNTAFNGAEWVKLLFLLSDMQAWVHEMEKDVFRQLPVKGKNKLFTTEVMNSSFLYLFQK